MLKRLELLWVQLMERLLAVLLAQLLLLLCCQLPLAAAAWPSHAVLLVSGHPLHLCWLQSGNRLMEGFLSHLQRL